ncbi:MAG: hypothetical protein FWB97_10925 [Oscillospiraceae bacterium]|nr:hypothetical protein [Oscillospiraceae bacterium]
MPRGLRRFSFLGSRLACAELYWHGVSEFEMLLKAAGFANARHEFGYGDESQRSLVTFAAVK